MNKIKTTLSIAAIMILAGCGGNQIDVTKYSKTVNLRANVPDVCKPEYKSVMPRVAVVGFTNNSTFGKANISTNNKNSSAVVGMGISSTGFIAGGKSSSNSESTTRKVDAKLSESVVPLVESMISNTGGAILISRTDMDKVNKELKLQDSGLLDSNSVVAFGNSLGAQFLITGSINNVEQKYTDNSKAAGGVADATQHSDNKAVRLLGSLLKLGASMTDGMKITTSFTIKIIDVETGKIVLSEDLEESTNIGKMRRPTYDQIVGGIKKNIKDALPKLNEQFSRYFAVKGYITQLKSDGSNIIAQVNIGSKAKVKENQIFSVYAFQRNEDPVSGNISCDRLELPIKLVASNQITKDKTWTTVDGDASKLKSYQLVQKTSKKAGFGF